MKTIGKYIIEKLKLNKDSKLEIKNDSAWLKDCETIIFDYLDRKISHSLYTGEYIVEYANSKLNIIFTEPIAFAVLERLAGGLLTKLGDEEELIDADKNPDIKCISNKWTITFYK